MDKTISELAKSVKQTLMRPTVIEIYDLMEAVEEGVIDIIINEVLKEKALEAGICPECAADYEFSELVIVFNPEKAEAVCNSCGFSITVAEKEKESDV